MRYRTGLVFFVSLVVLAVIGPWIAPYDPLLLSPDAVRQPPSWAHWFGTDQLGRDVLSRVLAAARIDLMMAFGAVALAGTMGTLLGAVLGFFFPGRVDRVAHRLVDVLMAFPLFVLAMVLTVVLGNTVMTVVWATAIVNLPFYIRLARAEVSRRRHAGYVEAARMGGSGEWRVLWRFVLPGILPAMIILASVNLGWVMLNAAALFFLGLGIRPPTAEWGVMVSDGARYLITGDWWMILFPALALIFAVFTFYLLGDGLRDWLDPEGQQ